jgi:hypothetical protein
MRCDLQAASALIHFAAPMENDRRRLIHLHQVSRIPDSIARKSVATHARCTPIAALNTGIDSKKRNDAMHR